ncbi:SRPBCC domain-containing protein [Rufibacter roseus]|uniref:SRPBCC domain-containing protein n=1 Tax=Rufibacter roseus TaxID=1567108 RepID=A0ABW2DTA2_9BACT|nr:SRPBCC domain-containing protein [Rufibacter roseus]
MEPKTHLTAEEGKQEIFITRSFDLPLDLLFKAYTEPELVEQWMGNKVLKLENTPHGGYQFETRDAQEKVLFRANGTIHSFVPNQNITRTFEMENTPFPVQLEFLDFEAITDEKSKLTMQMVFKSVADRDNMLKLPFAQGINMAHNQLQTIMSKAKPANL